MSFKIQKLSVLMIREIYNIIYIKKFWYYILLKFFKATFLLYVNLSAIYQLNLTKLLFTLKHFLDYYADSSRQCSSIVASLEIVDSVWDFRISNIESDITE